MRIEGNARVGPIQGGRLINVFMISSTLGGIICHRLTHLTKPIKDLAFGASRKWAYSINNFFESMLHKIEGNTSFEY